MINHILIIENLYKIGGTVIDVEGQLTWVIYAVRRKLLEDYGD